jgi:hypothetical protein
MDTWIAISMSLFDALFYSIWFGKKEESLSRTLSKSKIMFKSVMDYA